MKIISGNNWDNSAFSTQGYSGGVYMTFTMNGSNNAMGGFSEEPNPQLSPSYLNGKYIFYAVSNTSIEIWENGTLVQNNLGNYNSNTVFLIIYDGLNVIYYINGIVVRRTFHINCTFA
jgi:hypothetical protein